MEGFPSPTLDAAHLTLWTTMMCCDQSCFTDEEAKHSKVRKPDHVHKTIPTAQEWAEIPLALEPWILDHCVNCCLSMQQAEQKSFWFSLQMRSFSNFPKMREPKRMMIFFFIQVKIQICAETDKAEQHLAFGQSQCGCLSTGCDWSKLGSCWLNFANLTSELETRASTAVQTGERYSLVGNVSPSQS